MTNANDPKPDLTNDGEYEFPAEASGPPPVVRDMRARLESGEPAFPAPPPAPTPMKDETYHELVAARYTFAMGVIRGSERTLLLEALSRALEECRWSEAFFLADRLDDVTGRANAIEQDRAEQEAQADELGSWNDRTRLTPNERMHISEESRRIAAQIEERRKRWSACA